MPQWLCDVRHGGTIERSSVEITTRGGECQISPLKFQRALHWCETAETTKGEREGNSPWTSQRNNFQNRTSKSSCYHTCTYSQGPGFSLGSLTRLTCLRFFVIFLVPLCNFWDRTSNQAMTASLHTRTFQLTNQQSTCNSNLWPLVYQPLCATLNKSEVKPNSS